MKRPALITKYIILMLLGAMIYGFIGAAAEVSGSRSAGNIGGEALVLPLMIGLIWFGWELHSNFK